MNTSLDSINKNIFSILLVVTVFVPFFYVKTVPVLIILLFFLWIFKYKSFNNFYIKLKFIFPYLIYAFTFLCTYLFFQKTTESLKVLERQIPFIILPFFIFFKKWTADEIVSFRKIYVNTVLAISVFSLVKLLYFYFTNLEFVSTMDETYLQWKLPHLAGFHPTYFGLAIVVSNLMLINCIKKNGVIIKNRKFYLAIFLTIYLVYLSPRTPIICQFIVWFWFLFEKLKIKNLRLNNLFFFLLIVITSSIFFTSKYVISKFSNSISDKRFLLWEPAFNIIKKNYFIFGEGLGNGKNEIQNFISNNKLNQFEVVDLHNQYLTNYLDLGFLGLLAIGVTLFLPLFFIKRNELYMFVIVFSIAMLTETYLYVIKGIVFFIIIYCYLTIKNSYQTLEG